MQQPYLLELNENMSKIFFHSRHYLFHTYALYNLTHAVKRNRRYTDAQKNTLTCKFVLAALSCPLNHSLSNFERLSTQYLPRELQGDVENSQKIRSEVGEVSSMLYISGVPSRQSLIDLINASNMQLVIGYPEIAELFRLLEVEQSPFTISKEGIIALNSIVEKDDALAQYLPFIKKALAVRILQKSKNFYRNLKFTTLSKLLCFYEAEKDQDNWANIEKLLYECSRETLVKTVIDHQSMSISFDKEVEVIENLVSFGNKLRKAFL